VNTTLAALKERLDGESTDPRSTDRNPTPLWLFLYLYILGQPEAYISYMAGARALRDYLSPINTSVSELGAAYIKEVPPMLLTYELVELAKLLYPTQVSTGCAIIYYTIHTEVIPRLPRLPTS